MELVKVTGPGAAHYQPETYDGSRFDYNQTTNTWTRKRDGWTWTYGDEAAGATRSIVSSPLPVPLCVGHCNTESWFLRSVLDPFKNRIDYTYRVYGTVAAFSAQYPSYPLSKDHLVSTITYGAGTATVTFTYETRPDLSVDMSGGMPVFRQHRLKQIRSTTRTQMYSRYHLQYENEGPRESDPVLVGL